jgi:outer membrane protein OmpA-like peptidoglycan-associated protein
MSSSNNYRRENYNAWTWGIAALILLALLWLWITGRGPGNGAACCGGAVAVAPAAAPAVAPTPAAPPAPAPVAAAPAPAAPAAPAATPTLPDATAAATAAVAQKPLAKLYFATGKPDVPADTPKLIADVVAYLQKNPQSKAVISGFNDPRGNAAANAELSKNRAKAAREALKAAGVDEARIELRKPQETTLGGDQKEARRVEITVEP